MWNRGDSGHSDPKVRPARGGLYCLPPRACDFFDAKYFGGIIYARLLTVEHTKITKATIDDLIALGFSEGEVLEINQLASYFNYVNRMVVGLGVNTEGASS